MEVTLVASDSGAAIAPLANPTWDTYFQAHVRFAIPRRADHSPRRAVHSPRRAAQSPRRAVRCVSLELHK